ncbi:MAG: hydrogenase expression/formation protein [Thiobacillaceae bacterium]|jgi:hydrogenase-1 operon protein HyaF|nr:hydrogenase expression/formation protein [Thiobacillaceae bacterium]
MTLESIPVRVAGASAAEPGLSGNAPPLLHELAQQLRQLLASDVSSAIDLGALPLTPADLAWLKERLGQGEISVTLQANGESTLAETACPGIWWVTHRNEKGVVGSEFLEVAYVPELVKAHPGDVELGLERLESLISDLS